MDQSTRIKMKIASYLKDAVAALQQENISAEEPIGSCDTTNAVCHAIEAAFLHDLKGSSLDKNFWTLLKKYSHKSTRNQISELSQISTDIGRCRAWIRVTINEFSLESYLRVIIADTKTLQHYYRQTAFLRDDEHPGILLTYVQGLSEFPFNLATNSTVLNQWTSTSLVLSGLLPPSDILYPHVSTPPVSHVDTPVLHQALSASLRPAVSSHHGRSYSPAIVTAFPSSNSCPHHLNRVVSLTDSLQLTQAEIEALQDLLPTLRARSSASSASTPTSMMSHPDFADVRPDIYRFVYDISPDHLSVCGSLGTTHTEAQLNSKFDEIVAGSAECSAMPDAERYDKPITVCPPPSSGDKESKDETKVNEQMAITVEEVAVQCSSEVSRKVESETVNVDPTLEHSVSQPVITSVAVSQVADVPQTTLSSHGELDSSAPHHKESFHSLLKNYNAAPMRIPTVEEIIQTLPQDRTSGSNTPHTHTSSSSCDQHMTANCEEPLLDIEPDLPSLTQQSITLLKSNDLHNAKQFLLSICNEKGLNQQCYQCRGCARPIGVFYGKERLCEFDGYYYCYECHENDQHYIPAYIVFNWDFRPYQVCRRNLKLLVDIEDEPFINLDQVNINLYNHVKALNEVMLLRMQLHALKAFIYSCKQPIVEEFEAKLHGKLYLAEHIHVYSLKDLTRVASGHLAPHLKRVVDYGIAHVYGCVLCSQKGFICELCHHLKVIYPFELSTTTRCDACKAVFHTQCKTKMVPCPRCARRRNSASFQQSDPIDRVSFSFPEDIIAS